MTNFHVKSFLFHNLRDVCSGNGVKSNIDKKLTSFLKKNIGYDAELIMAFQGQKHLPWILLNQNKKKNI